MAWIPRAKRVVFFLLRSQSAAAGLFFRVFTSLRLPGHDAHLLHTAPCHLLYCDMQPLELKLVALCRHTAQGLHDPAAYRNRVKFSLCQAARTHLLHLRRRAPDTRPARAALSAAPRGRLSSQISPTISSKISSSVTMPAVPPNSSTTTAICSLLCWSLLEQCAYLLFFGAEQRRARQRLRGGAGFLHVAHQVLLIQHSHNMVHIPAVNRQARKTELEKAAAASCFVASVRTPTISGRGVMISHASSSENSMAFRISAPSCSPMPPPCRASSTMVSSSPLCDRSVLFRFEHCR